MTLVAAWVRSVKGTRELVVAADSLLSGGIHWDGAPKIFPLKRGDAVLAFGGESTRAYPLIAQLQELADDDRRGRARDLCELKGDLERACRSMLDHAAPQPGDHEWRQHFQVMLAGYSWRHAEYRIWSSGVFDGVWKLACARYGGRGVALMGDRAGVKAATEKVGRVYTSLRSAGAGGRINWEPLDVLCDVIRDPAVPSVGGAPQMVKVYRHLGHQAFAIRWEGELTVLGRRLGDRERTERREFKLDAKEHFGS